MQYRSTIMYFLLIAAIPCTTLAGPLADGYYILDAPFFYKKGICRIVKIKPNGYQVDLLERRGGTFEFKVKNDRTLKIVNAEISFDKIRRTLGGSGEITGPNQAEGKGVTWIKTIGIFSRNHHKGTWKLSPASRDEVSQKLDRLRESTGKDLPDF